MTRRNTRAYAAAAITAALTLGLTACGGSDNGATNDPTPTTSAPSTPTSSAPPTPKTPQELAKAALERYFTISEKAQATGSLKVLAPLSKVATGDAFFNMHQLVSDYGDNGVRLQGTIGHTLSQPTMPNGRSVVFTDCQDHSKSKVIVKKTGQVVPQEGPNGEKVPTRYKIDYTVVNVNKQVWRVALANEHWDQKC